MDDVRIAILDPHEVVVAGLTRLLGETSTGMAVVPLAERESPPDVVLYSIDEETKDLHDPHLHALLRSRSATVIALYWNEDSPAIRAALTCGAHGALSKRLTGDDLCREIRRIADGRDVTVTPPQDGECDPEIVRVGLTPRELDVLGLIGAGLTNRELAEQLHLSINSVKTYIRSAYEKIGVQRRAQAVIWVERHGLSTPVSTLDEPIASLSPHGADVGFVRRAPVALASPPTARASRP